MKQIRLFLRTMYVTTHRNGFPAFSVLPCEHRYEGHLMSHVLIYTTLGIYIFCDFSSYSLAPVLFWRLILKKPPHLKKYGWEVRKLPMVLPPGKCVYLSSIIQPDISHAECGQQRVGHVATVQPDMFIVVCCMWRCVWFFVALTTPRLWVRLPLEPHTLKPLCHYTANRLE